MCIEKLAEIDVRLRLESYFPYFIVFYKHAMPLASAVCCAAAVLLSTAPANAQDMDDKAMERRVRHMSVAIGNAYVCTEKEARGAFKEESHLLFDLIV